MDGKIKLYDGLELKEKQEPTSQDLTNLAQFGIDLTSGSDYGVTLLETFKDMEKMRELCNIIFEGDIPKVIEPKVKSTAINEALRSFFVKFGVVLQ